MQHPQYTLAVAIVWCYHHHVVERELFYVSTSDLFYVLALFPKNIWYMHSSHPGPPCPEASLLRTLCQALEQRLIYWGRVLTRSFTYSPPLYRWANLESEMCSHLLKVAQLMRTRQQHSVPCNSRTHTACGFLKPAWWWKCDCVVITLGSIWSSSLETRCGVGCSKRPSEPRERRITKLSGAAHWALGLGLHKFLAEWPQSNWV